MPTLTLTLKSYQQAALDTLRAFPREAQIKGPALAFEELVGRPYNADPFGEVPCICLRIPTGGGKTLMAAHAVAVLAQQQRLRALRDLPDALVTPEEAALDPTGVLPGFIGQPRWSLANWLALHEPLLIVDEAHNTKTDKSFTALKRLNPSAILEPTATPISGKTSVMNHVTAQEPDGRIAVVEYKDAHLLSDPYEIEKRQIDELWARKSAGKCLFGQIAKDRSGVGMSGQLDALLT